MKLKTGIVGTGKVAGTHARALSELSRSNFRAVCSRDAEKTRNFAEPFGASSYTDTAEMVEKEKLDVVVICTPHPFHMAPAIAAIERGAHVIIEKPLASDLASCDAMVAAAAVKKVNLGTISQRRWYPPVRRIKTAIDEGRIGRPILGTVHMYGWRDQSYYESDPWRGSWAGEGGGVLVNQAPHQLDLLQWYMGPIDELFGYHRNFNHSYIEVEDTALAIVKFKSGALGQIIVSNSQDPALFGKVWVHGENGATIGVQTDGGAMFIAGMSKIEEPPLNDIWTIKGEQQLLDTWINEDTETFNQVDASEYYHRLQLEDFLDSVIEGRKPAVTGVDGRAAVEIFTAIYRSRRDGRPVKFPLEPEIGRDDYDGRLNIIGELND